MQHKFTSITHLKRAALTLLALIMTCATAQAQFSGGSGTQADPYLIGTSTGANFDEDLNTLRGNVNRGDIYRNDYLGEYFKIGLSNYDIPLTPQDWIPIGKDQSHPFRGHFDGNGCTIQNLTISGDDCHYAGFFGYIYGDEEGNYAEVTNLNFIETQINTTVSSSGKTYTGGVVACVGGSASVTNCSLSMTANDSYIKTTTNTSDMCYVGGIVGYFSDDGICQFNSVTLNGNAKIELVNAGTGGGVGGIVGAAFTFQNVDNNFVHANTNSLVADYKGAILGCCNAYSTSYLPSPEPSNYYHTNDNSLQGIGAIVGNNNMCGCVRVCKINPNNSCVSITSTPTVTNGGTSYYKAGTSVTVSVTEPFYSINSLSASTGSISNVSIASDHKSATFTVSSVSSDITLNVGTSVTTSGTTDDGLTWSLSGTGYHELTIGGNGAMRNYGHTTVNDLWRTTAPWGWHITKVTIGNGVTSIGNYAFVGCQQLGNITIGTGVTSIGQGAFDRCDAATEITLPANVTTIGSGAFAQCHGLVRINIQHNGAVTLSNSNVFTGCDALQYIVFPNPAAALANTTGNWSGYSDKLRAQFGNQLFLATNEGGTAAYKIATEQDLRNLSTAVNGGANGSGQTFRQTADITVSNNFTPIGSSSTNYFGGTYDGNTKTLTVNITDTENQGTALFRNIQGATIKNLILSGSVSGTIHAAALVGFSRGTNYINRCKVASNVTVTTPSGTNYHCGGLVGHALTSTLNIFRTVYCGTITNGGSFVGGFQGWSDGNTANISDCLFAGTYTGSASFHPIAVRNTSTNPPATVAATNTYYDLIPTITDYKYIVADGKKTTAVTSVPSNLGSVVETLSFMTVYQKGILFNGNYYAAPELTTDNSGAYLINNATNWTAFCDMLYDNVNYNRFCDKTVKLGASITVTRMAGSSGHDFCGTFDGQNNTLTFNYGSSSAYVNEEYIAPFHYVSNTKPAGSTEDSPVNFNNLKVAGTIYTSAKYTAGLVGRMWGTVNIQNCRVSTAINSNVEGDGTHGGIVGMQQSGTLTLRGCVFDGQLLGSSTNACAGIVGFRNSSATTDIYYTLFAPTSVTMSSTNSATFIRNANNNCHEGCYYTREFNDGTNNTTSQGQFAYAVATQPANIGTAGTNYGMVQAYTNGLKFDNKYYVGSDNNLTVNTAGTEYIIKNATGWNLFCSILASNDQGYFTGKTVKLDANITVSTMAGNDSHRFSGTFDGQQKTLTFSATPAANYMAPFRYVEGRLAAYHAVISNLNVVTTINATNYIHMAGLIANASGYVDVTGCNVTANITSTGTQTDLYPTGLVSQVASGAQLTVSGCTVGGTITTGGKYAAGYIGTLQGSASITNSVSSVTINSSVSGDGTHGGFVGAQSNTLAIEGCVFNGKLLSTGTTATNSCGGFVGWKGGTVNISNSLYAPATPGTGETWVASDDSYTFSRRSGTTITNSYYTQSFGEAQGTAARTVSAGENVTTCTVSPVGSSTTSYNVSGITAYSKGLVRDGNFYYGNGDVVNLTLASNATGAPAGYQYNYTVSDGTLTGSANPYTLQMPDVNVTVSRTLFSTGQAVSVTYMNANGTTGSHNAIALDETMTTLAAGWYFVGKDIAYNSTITLNGDVTIILADGKTMSVGTSETPISGDAIKGEIINYPNHYDYALTVYGQSLADSTAGTLSLHTSSYGIYVKAYTQHSGNVRITSVYNSGILTQNDAVTINGGNLDVNVGHVALYTYSDVIINGGTVNATGQTGGIYSSHNGNITLGWTNTSDYIYVNSYETTGTIAIASGQAFIDENNVAYSGTVNASAIAGKTLQPAVAVTLSEGITAGSGIIASGDDNYAKVGETVTISASTSTVPGYTNAVTYTPEGGEATAANDLGNGSWSFTVPAADVSVSAALQSTGQLVSVTYMNADGTTGTHNAIALDETMTTLAEGWYYVGKNVNYTQTVTLGGGEVTIILGDGCTMSIIPDRYTSIGINGSSNNADLTIYGQTDGDGTLSIALSIYNTHEGAGSSCNNITINSGIVNASTNVQIPIYAENIVTINGGKVTTTVNWYNSENPVTDIYGENGVVINGGQVSVTEIGNGIIGSLNGNITLSWTNADDYIYANRYQLGSDDSNVIITAGKIFYYSVGAGGTILGGDSETTLTAAEIAAIAHRTLRPAVAVTLSEGITASSGIIASGDDNYARVGQTVSVSVSEVPGYTTTVTYTPEGGEATEATDNGDGTWSFTVPTVNVSVSETMQSTGQPVSVTYINADGTTSAHDAIALDETMTTLAAGWYFVGKDIVYTGTITLNGNVTIILGDGATLNIGTEDARINNHCINGSYNYNLTIYGQANQTGRLNAYNNINEGIRVKNYNQHGGNVTSNNNHGYDALYTSTGNITLTHGNLTAYSTGWAIRITNNDYNLNISGGTLNATKILATINLSGGTLNVTNYIQPTFNYSGGIFNLQGELQANTTLTWTNPSDRFYANSIKSGKTVTITGGKAFLDEDGTFHTSDNVGNIAGKTLEPYIEGSVPYIDENGDRQFKYQGEYTLLEGRETPNQNGLIQLPGGWYVVNGNISYSNTIVFQADTYIILCDGSQMTFDCPSSGIGLEIHGDLTLYGQNAGTGTINATVNEGYNSAGIWANNVVINGGTIIANSINGGERTCGIYSSNTVTINGGKVTANSTGIGEYSYGIYATEDITLGWRNANDFIHASSYYSHSGTVSIAEGKAFIDEDGNTHNSGQVNASDINGKTLYAYIEGSVPYIDENGQRQLCTEYVTLIGNETTIGTAGQETWYVANGTLNYNQTLALNGDVHLILKDNAVMNVGTQSTISGHGINGNGHSISIYAQSMGSSKGQLHVNATVAGIFSAGGNITINGGEVEATGSGDYGHGICASGGNVEINGGEVVVTGSENSGDGIFATKSNNNGGGITISNSIVTASGDYGIEARNGLSINSGTVTANGVHYGLFASECITINGGEVSATSTSTDDPYSSGIYADGDIAISGGQVTANGSNNGIYADGGDITLGWTQITDFIYASAYTVSNNTTVVAGQALTDNAGNFYCGTLNHSQYLAMFDNTLQPAMTVTLSEGITAVSGIFASGGGNYAKVGETVRVAAVSPVPGYTPNAVIYTPEGGEATAATDNGDGTWSFTVPAANVSVSAAALQSTGLPVSVTYMNADGTTGTHEAIALDGNETMPLAANQWYYIGKDINYSQTVSFQKGDITLILGDGCTMNIGTSPNDRVNGIGIDGFDSGHASLTIYGQSLDDATAGHLSIFNIVNNKGGIYIVGPYTQHSGNVSVNCNGSTSKAIDCYYDFTLNGGTIDANSSNSDGISCNRNIAINGGKLDAVGREGQYGLSGNNITLGWTNVSDHIHVSRYDTKSGGTLSVAEGNAFIDGNGNIYSGTINKVNNAYPIDGKTLYPALARTIEGYDVGGGWVFISSPVAADIAPTAVHNLVAEAVEDYDLYRFNQSATAKEWQNWKQDEDYHNAAPGFDFENGKGYLYATKETRTLVFSGTYNTGNTKTVNLDYTEGQRLAGWNLVGNPFTVAASITDNEGNNKPFYVISGRNVVPNTGDATAIEPCTGVMVKANGTGESVTFRRATASSSALQPNQLQMTLAQQVVNRGGVSSTTVDNAIVSFNEGNLLEKFVFNADLAKLYIPQGGKDFAIVTSEGQGELPVNFEAKENGTYTITVNPEGVEMAYLHLIDNLTGADVDLLAGPSTGSGASYTFTAKTTDYESRFKLVFAVGSSTGSDTFAFYSNGNWIISNEGRATLQVIDINGRILSNEQINGSVSKAIHGAAGVYMLRLVNGDDVKVQKIVVR